MLGALIGAGLSLAGSIAGGIKSAKAAREQQRLINEQRAKNEAYFNKDYYQDWQDRSENQAAMERVRQTMQRRNAAIDQQSAVTGATPEATIAAKEQNTDAVVQAAQAMQAGESARKDAAQAQYRAREDAINQQQMQQQQMSEQGTANFANGALQSAAIMANSAIGGTKQTDLKLQTLQPSGVPQVDVPANAATKMQQEVAKSLETNFSKPKTI